MPTVEELQAEIQQLKQQIAGFNSAQSEQEQARQRQYLQSLPITERPLAERELRVQAWEKQLKDREEYLNTAAVAIKRKELSSSLFIPESEFEGITDLDQMSAKAQQIVMGRSPQELRQLAALNEALQSGSLPDPAAYAAASGTAPAPGATATPAGVGTAGGGGTAPQAESPIDQITKEYKGKGGTSLAEWLGKVHDNVGMESIGAPSGSPAPVTVPVTGAPTDQSGAVSPTVQPGAPASAGVSA